MATPDVSVKLVGQAELYSILKGLDYKTQHKFLKKVVSDASNVLIAPTKQVIPVRKVNLVQGGAKKWHPAGTGKKSIGKKAGRSKRNAVSFVGPRTNTGNFNTDGYYLKWWEHGSKKQTGTHAIQRVYESNLKKVENNMVVSIRKIMEREIKKYAKRA